MENKQKRVNRAVDKAVKTHLERLIEVTQSEREIGTLLNVLSSTTHFKIMDISLVRLPKHKYQVQIKVNIMPIGVDDD